MSISQQIPREIKSVCRCIGYAAWLDDFDSWAGLPVILAARLTPRQRGALAFMALKSLDTDLAMQTAEAALSDGAGQPIAPLFNHIEEAAFWADMAAPDELDAYAVAIFSAMSSGKKRAFLDFAGRAAA